MERLTTSQAAARSGASRFAIQRAKEKGRLAPIRDNRGRYLFDVAEIDAWAAERAHAVEQRERASKPADDDDCSPYEMVLSENNALRDRLADAEKRAAVAEALAEEKNKRIDDLISMMPILKR